MRRDGIADDRTGSLRERIATPVVEVLMDHVPMPVIVLLILTAYVAFYAIGAVVLGFALHLGWNLA